MTSEPESGGAFCDRSVGTDLVENHRNGKGRSGLACCLRISVSLLLFASAQAVPAQDDHGDTPQTATLISVGSITDGVLEIDDDLDYFRIEISSLAVYFMFSRGSTNVIGTLYDVNLNYIDSDNSSGELDNFRMDLELLPGTYYLEVKGRYSNTLGPYAVHIEGPGAGTTTDDHGYSPWSATPVNVGSVTDGSLDLEDDLDYLSIIIPDNAIYYFFSRNITGGDADTDATLYDANLDYLDSDSSSGELDNFRIGIELLPGVYYLEIRGRYSNTLGDYYIHIEGPGFPTDTDEHGTTPWSATPVTVGSITDGNIDLGGDLDYLRVDIVDFDLYYFFSRNITGGDADAAAALYDANLDYVAGDSSGGELDNFRFGVELLPGTYYLEVEGQYSSTVGPYHIHIEGPGAGTISDDHGFTPWSATPVGGGTYTDGELDLEGDLDYFRFQMAEVAMFLGETLGTTNTAGTLYDANLDYVASDSNDGEFDNFRIELELQPGTYYLLVEGQYNSTTGEYQLHIEGPPPPEFLPDLVPSDISVVPSNPIAGTTVTVSFTVRNQGIAPAAATTTRLRLNRSPSGSTPSDPVLGDISTPALLAGESVQLNTDVTIPPDSYSGTHYVWVILDNFSSILQSNTNNDFGSRLITVNGIPAPPGPFTLWGEDYCDTQPPGPSPGVRLNWSPAAGAESYELYRDGAPYAGPFPPTQLSFLNNANVIEGATYNYEVRAANSVGETSSNSEEVEVSEYVCNLASQFDFSDFWPTPPYSAGVPFEVTITAKDPSGNLADYAGEVFLSTNLGSLVTPHRFLMSNGFSILNVSLDNGGEGMRLNAFGTGISGVSDAFDVVGGSTDGVLSGVVSLPDGSALEAAQVHLTDGPGVVSPATTDSHGQYLFSQLPCGRYSAFAEYSGEVSELLVLDVTCGVPDIQHFTVPFGSDCNPSGLTPVLLVPGFFGSTVGSDWLPYPLLTRRAPTDSADWGRDPDSPATAGLFDVGNAPGWEQLVEELGPAYEPGCTVFPVPWDWRRPVGEAAVTYLKNQVDRAKLRSGRDSVHIVAHSMGGLVSRAYIQGDQYEDDVDQLIMVGTPNRGAPKAFYPWQGGVTWIRCFPGSTFLPNPLCFWDRTAEGLYRTMFFGTPNITPWFRARDMFRLVPHLPLLRQAQPLGQFLEVAGEARDLGCSPNSELQNLNTEAEVAAHFGPPGNCNGRVCTTVLAGVGEPTMEIIEVGEKDCGRERWKEGRPGSWWLPTAYSDYRLSNEGDGLVMERDTFLGDIQPENSRSGEHSKLIYIYRDRIAALINGQQHPLPLGTEPEQDPASTLSILIRGRTRPLVTNPLGESAGIDPNSGSLVRQILGSSVQITGEAANVGLESPVEGEYSVELSGPFEESVQLEIEFIQDDVGEGKHADLFFQAGAATVWFMLTPDSESKITFDRLPSAPTGLRAELLEASSETQLVWDQHSDSSVVLYSVYSRLERSPNLEWLGSTSSLTFNTGDPWSGGDPMSTRSYAISALYGDASESFLSDEVRNDDRDHDGLSDLEEGQIGTDPRSSDTDGDGLTDGEESMIGTDPLRWDTDGDGASDSHEIAIGADPTDHTSFPVELEISKSGLGTGRVTSDPSGVDCDSTCSGEVVDFPNDTEVQLFAVPTPGSIFVGWAGDSDCFDGVVALTTPTSCIATFDLGEPPIFFDGFESGDTSAWSRTVP